MKTFISIIIFLLSICQTTGAQDNSTVPTDSKNYDLGKKYLKKSKTQKTIAWVMAGTGATIFILGAVSSASASGNNSNDLFEDALNEYNEYTGGVAMIAGGTLIVGSIPLFIISSNNRKKAELYLSPVNTVNLSSHKNYPQMGIVLRF